MPSRRRRRRHRLGVAPIKARSASDGDCFAPSPPSRRRLRLSVAPNKSPERKRRDSGPLGETGIDDRPAGPVARPKSMDDGIGCDAVSPDWRRGLL